MCDDSVMPNLRIYGGAQSEIFIDRLFYDGGSSFYNMPSSY
jgi:hypothetical protein